MRAKAYVQQKKVLCQYWRASGLVTDRRVLEAFLKVRRELFVLPEDKEQAYVDDALPILEGQTISQPSTVLAMTEALRVFPGAKVLEVGTGSGYQAAILAALVGKKGSVWTVERKRRLVEFARANMQRGKVKNVHVVEGDGSKGYGKEAPYDRIIVTAAAPRIPEPLKEQLKVGGILLVPVGARHEQRMVRMTKGKAGFHEEHLGWYIFVPLHGKYGFGEEA